MTSEPFLEEEIKYISSSFNNVYIFSADAKKNDVLTRRVPDNVHVFPLNTRKHGMIKGIIKGATSFNRDLIIKENDFKKTIYSLYYKGKSIIIAEKIKRLIMSNKIDLNDTVIYSYWFTYLAISGWLIRKWALLNGYHCVKVVSRAHGHDLYSYSNSLNFLPFQALSLSKIDGLYCCSNNGKDYLQNKYPSFHHKIHTARLGTTEPEKRQFALKESKKSYTFATCSNLYKLKRVSLFASAFAIALKERPNMKWLCIGEGEEKDQIIKILKENNAFESVCFAGRLKNKSVLELYKKTSIYYFVNVSEREGIPVSIMESQSYGIPTIATNVGGVSEIVNESNGFLLEKDISSNYLSKVLIKAYDLSLTKSYNNLSISAKKTWKKESDARVNYSQWASLLINY